MYEDICYEKPFLKEVIVRVDLSSPIRDIGKKLPPPVASRIANRFPIVEPKKGIEEEMQFSPSEMHRKRSEFTIWNYFGLEREKRVSIAPDHIVAVYRLYKTFEKLYEDFIDIMDALTNSYPDFRGRRVGLRYINVINEQSSGLTDPFSWNEYINSGMLGLFSHFTDRPTLNRIFHIVELRYEGVNVKYQFGMPNPDFPAPIKKPYFVLDLDGYVDGSQDLSEIGTSINRAHEKIQELYEGSITNKLRERMNDR